MNTNRNFFASKISYTGINNINQIIKDFFLNPEYENKTVE